MAPIACKERAATVTPGRRTASIIERNSWVSGNTLVLQSGFISGSSFPMAFPGSLLVPTTPARPCACNLGIRRPGPNQMPEQASHFGHGEGQEIGFEIERVFFPRPQHDGSRRDRHAPASPA